MTVGWEGGHSLPWGLAVESNSEAIASSQDQLAVSQHKLRLVPDIFSWNTGTVDWENFTVKIILQLDQPRKFNTNKNIYVAMINE